MDMGRFLSQLTEKSKAQINVYGMLPCVKKGWGGLYLLLLLYGKQNGKINNSS